MRRNTALADFLRERGEAILTRWERAQPIVSASSREPLRRHLAVLVDRLAARLELPELTAVERTSERPAPELAPPDGATSLEEVLHAYAGLRRALVAALEEEGPPADRGVFEQLHAELDGAIAQAARSFAGKDREAAARAMRDAERRAAELEAVLESIPEAVYVGDLTGIKRANRVALEQLGFDTVEQLDQNVGKLVELIQVRRLESDETVGVEDQVFVRALRGETASYDVRVKNLHTGEDRVVHSSAAPIRVDGQIVGAVAINSDVTEGRRHAEEMRRTAEFRERFIGILGHDLRGPLSAIRIGAEVLLRSEALPDVLRRPVNRILDATTRMGRMVSDVLDFTRGRLAGGIPISPRPADLRALVKHVAEEVELSRPGAEIQVTGAGDLQGEWDPDRLAQVAQNLLLNAIDHGVEGRPIRVQLGSAGDEVGFSVANAGAPIPPEVLPTLFDPFRGGERASGSGGLGLGLYIVHEIVRAHGGTVEATSNAEETLFRVRLPRRASARA